MTPLNSTMSCAAYSPPRLYASKSMRKLANSSYARHGRSPSLMRRSLPNFSTAASHSCGNYIDRMLRIGAHMSVAGGVSKAVERAIVHGCEALQIFTKNASQWRGKPLDQSEIRLFRQRLEQTGITPVVSHASYLINLAT